jgi:pimeloyl-ACP methyl ester carboxylesterase
MTTHSRRKWTHILAMFGMLPLPGVSAGQSNPAPAVVPGQPYVSAQATDSSGRTITYYLSEQTADAALPLVLYVQGSGAVSLFNSDSTGRVYGTMGHGTVHDVFADIARILVVEKPGVGYLDNPASAQSASIAFHQEHTLDRWTDALRSALGDGCMQRGVACERGVLVIGHSEGGIAAARLAGTSSAVTHAAVLAGEGPTQLFSLLRLAGSGDLFARHGDTPADREEYLIREWNKVLADPTRSDRFFFGHPYRRWSTFLQTSTAAELTRRSIPVFIGQGTADRAVDPESADVLFTMLAAGGRDVCYSRIEGADHSFAHAAGDDWSTILRQLRVWFIDEQRGTDRLLCSPPRS